MEYGDSRAAGSDEDGDDGAEPMVEDLGRSPRTALLDAADFIFWSAPPPRGLWRAPPYRHSVRQGFRVWRALRCGDLNYRCDASRDEVGRGARARSRSRRLSWHRAASDPRPHRPKISL